MASHCEEINAVLAERERDSYEDNVDEEDGNWDDWNSENGEESEDFKNPEMLCLFCDSLYRSSDSLFQHCAVAHHFDFHAVKNAHGLDFYSCLKLINYIRTQGSQVLEVMLDQIACMNEMNAAKLEEKLGFC